MSDVSYRDFLNHTLNLSPEDKVSIARSSLEKIIDRLEKLGATNEEITKVIISFTRLFVSSDVKTTAKAAEKLVSGGESVFAARNAECGVRARRTVRAEDIL